MKELEVSLRSWLRGAKRLAIVGVGSTLRGDDGVGVQIVRLLRGRVPDWVYLVKAESVPESYIGPIVRFKPTHILFIDAADIGMKPGEARLIEPSEVVKLSFSTHTLPFSVISGFLAASLDAKVAILGIQPKSLEFGEAISKEVRSSAKRVVELLARFVGQSQAGG